MNLIHRRLGAAILTLSKSYSSVAEPTCTPFHPNKVLILTKFSRLEFEKLRYSSLNAEEVEKTLKKRGSDYRTLLYHHYIHKGCEERVNKCFLDFGVETRVVNRFNYTEENIDWADVIVTTGGDGTFLMAACRIQDREKPIIGFNTDPTRSEGYLCLPKQYSVNVKDAITKMFEGKFNWTFRKRLRISLIGNSAYQAPIELHDQQLEHPEYRFFDCLQEQHRSATVEPEEPKKNVQKRVLPVLALNEVYFGECVSARVSYFEISKDGGERVKTKNAGLCVATGTGSTSWSYNISKISPATVEELIRILCSENAAFSGAMEQNTVDNVTKAFNKRLIFSSESSKMLYTLRDPIGSYSLPMAAEVAPRGFVKTMEIRSRCFDACMVIDGGLSFSFNDGTIAILDMHDSDALRTIVKFHGDD